MKEEETKYIGIRIKKLIGSIEHNHYQTVVDPHYEDDEEWPGWTETWLEKRIEDLYYLIIAYLEAQQLQHFLQTFKLKFEERVISGNGLLTASPQHPDDHNELEIIVGFKQFLEPFKQFDYRPQDLEEAEKLVSILKNTGHIIKKMGTKVTGEAAIYNAVKWIIGLYYPQTRHKNKASFIHQFKNYNPDILIPELKTAIEYKLIDDPQDNIDDFLDQIKKDEAVYVDDPKYNVFYAVIYIEDISVATPESIQAAWNSKKFTSNWKLILTGSYLTNAI